MGHAYVTKARRSAISTRDFQIFLGICVAALAAAVVWLAKRDRHEARPAALQQHVTALEQRVATLQSRLTAVESTARSLAADTASRLDAQATEIVRLRSQSAALVSTCLTEVQQEIDDIRSYIAFGGAIRKRVSPECTNLLRPRFGG